MIIIFFVNIKLLTITYIHTRIHSYIHTYIHNSDRMSELKRQKEKLEEKIMEQFKRYDPTRRKSRSFGSSLYRRAKGIINKRVSHPLLSPGVCQRNYHRICSVHLVHLSVYYASSLCVLYVGLGSAALNSNVQIEPELKLALFEPELNLTFKKNNGP